MAENHDHVTPEFMNSEFEAINKMDLADKILFLKVMTDRTLIGQTCPYCLLRIMWSILVTEKSQDPTLTIDKLYTMSNESDAKLVEETSEAVDFVNSILNSKH